MRRRLGLGLFALLLGLLASLPTAALPEACSCQVCFDASPYAKCTYGGRVWTCEDFKYSFCYW